MTSLPLVHVVDVDSDSQVLLTRWLAAAGMESRTYSSLGAFVSEHPVEPLGCLVIDVGRYALVVTACQADVAMPDRAMKTGAIDFVEKPLREQEVVKAVRAAIEVDHQQRLMASRRAVLHVKFTTLSPRERQVMALVTAGKLNKQVGADLGVSEITVKAHRGAVMRKMGARSLADLVRMADALGEALASPSRNDCSRPARNAVAADRRSGCTLALAPSA